MELYTRVAYAISKRITTDYSTSFSSSSTLFSPDIRSHVYAIYGLVRIADEIVDSYHGPDAAELLSALERDVYEAITRQYSPNPVVHAFALTARRYGIDQKLIQPFFHSMAMDLEPQTYTADQYKTYIYGSAEVVGLMCLRVFVSGDDDRYESLRTGAQALGAAYQKVNFLRDIKADHDELGRVYFPGVIFDAFNETMKHDIIRDIEQDFAEAKLVARQLPNNSRDAVRLSIAYYGALLEKIKHTPAEVIKQQRIRVSARVKAMLYTRALFVKVRRGL